MCYRRKTISIRLFRSILCLHPLFCGAFDVTTSSNIGKFLLSLRMNKALILSLSILVAIFLVLDKAKARHFWHIERLHLFRLVISALHDLHSVTICIGRRWSHF